jgi:hypothetical protein
MELRCCWGVQVEPSTHAVPPTSQADSSVQVPGTGVHEYPSVQGVTPSHTEESSQVPGTGVVLGVVVSEVVDGSGGVVVQSTMFEAVEIPGVVSPQKLLSSPSVE